MKSSLLKNNGVFKLILLWKIRNINKIIMKQVFVLLLSFLLVPKSEAQFFKKIVTRIKDDAAWRISNKVDNEIRKGVDSIFEMPKKIKGKNSVKASTEEIDKKSTADNQEKNKNEAGNNTITASDENDMKPVDGFITLALSANTIFTGGSLRISGQSIMYKDYKQVEIKVTGPSTSDVKNISLDADGNYFADWIASEKTGDYAVTVTGSDKKSKQSVEFSVAEIDIIFADEWPEENTKQIKKALDNLEEAVGNVESGISTKDKATLEQKMDELRAKTADVLNLFKDLNKAGKEISKLAKAGKKMSPALAGNLSELNQNLNEQAVQMKKISEVADHKPADNTICEYLVMVNEACAAFSTFTNVWSKSLGTILKNITIDKAVPKTVEVMNNNRLPPDVEFMGKESSKIFATSLFDAESLSTKLGKTGFAGDLIQYASDVLLKTYCGIYKGNFTHDYTIEFRNNKGENWWTYGAEMKATFSLRYPKKNAGDIIKMKGNLEGNATKFTFFEDIAKENDFHSVSKGKIEVVPIKTFTPLAVSVATSERDIMGFGAIARGLATPAYFNIPIDAEYDVDAKKIKIFVNDALVDFTDLVANQFVFLMIGQDMIPYPKKMNFPIHKAKTTINGIFIFFKEFDIEKDSKFNESFHGKGNRHIGDKTSIRETNLNFTLTAKKE